MPYTTLRTYARKIQTGTAFGGSKGGRPMGSKESKKRAPKKIVLKQLPETFDHGPFMNIINKDLSSRKLTGEEKTWLGEQLNNGNATSGQLSRTYKLNENTLFMYANKIKEGRALDQGGRPKGRKDSLKRVRRSGISNNKKLRLKGKIR